MCRAARLCAAHQDCVPRSRAVSGAAGNIYRVAALCATRSSSVCRVVGMCAGQQVICTGQQVICTAQQVCVPFVFRSMFVLMGHRTPVILSLHGKSVYIKEGYIGGGGGGSQIFIPML